MQISLLRKLILETNISKKLRSRMHMRVSNGLSKKQIFLFVCLLLILMSRLKVEAANTTSDNNNSVYPVLFHESSPASQNQIKYDVFVNFRGSDIRRDFLSYLVEAFSRKQIFPFVDDKLPRGDDISESLLGAIERSYISLVIFSQDYATSSWCLDELVKIVQCRKKDRQIVLPVFYKVDPTDVRHQKGTYGNAFVEHEKKYNLTRVLAWRSALNESASISGFHSSNFLNDAKLVEDIVKRVLTRLGLHQVNTRLGLHQVNTKRLIGIGKKISHVESLLQVESKDVRSIGIWGMSGVGKTTIAEELYNKLLFEYDQRYFMANIREESARYGLEYLKKQLFSSLLNEQDLNIDTLHGLPPFIERRLRRMKVFVVLDDVNDPRQLEILIGRLDWFGAGSRIIITTRDKQVLAKKVVDIYEVKALDFDESFQLFNLIAFKQNHPEIEYNELSKKMVNYAKGIPLVLKVLGHHLRGKDKIVWESQLKKLEKLPIKEVHDIIRLSYNDLDRNERKIFLDIACFFDGLHLKVHDIKLLLKDRGYSMDVELESLKNKALITISRDNVVSMHSIIQETAWEIVREESNEDPVYQSRLLDSYDISQVLKNKKGNEVARSIAINLLINKELQLNPQVFAKMSRLQYLDIYSKISYIFPQNRGFSYLPQGLESLPNELRYLRWEHYPLESLPSKYSGEKLVMLNLQYSRVKKLWHEEKDLVNLKYLILRSSSHLVELPDLSRAINLAEIDLRLCVGLTSIHPSIFSLNRLEKLDLGGCISLTSLQSNIQLSSLRYLSLASCSALKEFSVTSKNMVKLNLELSGIKQLPSSIGFQTKLLKLLLAYTYIENLPESIKHLTRLRYLDLRHCRELRSLPELPSSLETLDASGCVSLETLAFPPTALQQLKENKIRVAFWNCLKLDEHSLKAIELNAHINIMRYAHQHMSTPSHDYNARGTYVYPGRTVPEWLVYRTRHDYMTIDLSFVEHSSQLGFIFCFIVPKVESQGFILRFNISVGEYEDFQVYLDRPSRGIKSKHVYIIYDWGLSRYLNSQAKNQLKLKIKVTLTAVSRTPASEYVPLTFGVSPINTSQYLNYLQQMESVDDACIQTPYLIVVLILLFATTILWLFSRGRLMRRGRQGSGYGARRNGYGFAEEDQREGVVIPREGSPAIRRRGQERENVRHAVF